MPQFNPAIPIYRQIMDEVSGQIISGKLKPGQQLPSVREMAQSFQVNPNTIARAYQELEREGIVFTRRGQGTFASKEEEVLAALKQEKVLEIISRFFAEMSSLGFSKEESLAQARTFEGGDRDGACTGSQESYKKIR